MFDSNISDKCKIQKYNLELRKKLKAYTMSRFYLFQAPKSVDWAENNSCAIRGNEWDIIWNSNVNIQLNMCIYIR